MNYYADTKDAPLSELFRQANIKNDNKLMAFSDYSWKYCTCTGISTVSYIILYQGVPIDHVTHVPGPISQSSAESEYNAACNAGMALAHLRMLIHELLNKDPDIVPEEASINILDINSAVFMDNNGKNTKHTEHRPRRVGFVRNGEKCKIHKIEWCEGGLQLAYIATKNVGENDLNPRMEYVLVRLEN